MRGFVLLALLVGSAGAAWGGVPLIDDDFTNAPCCTRADYDAGTCDLDWVCQGSAVWISPDADECDLDLDDDGNVDANVFDQFVSFDPSNPCTQYPGEGYVLVTPAITNQIGNMFRKERILYDNFKLTAEVELRDGSIGRPADGMCIVIIGTDDVPPIGAGGGAMGSTGMGVAPTMIFEFDNWSCNTGDNNDQNHVQFAWAPNGFNAVDAIPITPSPQYSGVFSKVDEATYPLNNRQPPPSEPNRFLFEVIVQGGTVACFLTNDDAGLPRTKYYTFTIPNFSAFEGFLGVTGSTGGAWQNQILHSVKIEAFDGCLKPPALVTRDLKPERNPQDNSGDYQSGDVIAVDLTLSDIRTADARCAAASGIVLTEIPPTGWVPVGGSITDGGSYSAATGEITWTLTGASFVNGRKVSYSLTVPDPVDPSVTFNGTYAENIALSESSVVGGETILTIDSDFDDCGGIKAWNILGGYTRPNGGATPTEDEVRLDYLTDGSATEFDFVWFPGASVNTVFGGDGFSAAYSLGIQSGSRTDINPEGLPTVFAWNDLDAYIEYEHVFAAGLDGIMVYAQCYVINETGAPIDNVFLASASDDAIQVILNGSEAWVNAIARGGATACAPQDISPDGTKFTDTFTLEEGENSLIVKVFEIGGGWNHSFRFQNDLAEPITEGLKISKFPISGCVRAPLKATRSIDTGKTTNVEGKDLPLWTAGESYPVSLAVTDIRGTVTGCTPPTDVTIRDIAPAGWTPSAPSNGGTVQNNIVTWHLTGGAIAPTTLTYTVKAGPGSGTVLFSGNITDTGSIAPFPIVGEKTLYNPSSLTDQGFIQRWLLLGPYKQPGLLGLDAPGEDKMRQDHLKDNKGITEVNVRPSAGDTVATDFGPGAGKARSTGLAGAPTCPINPNGVPTWAPWQDSDELIAFESYYCGDTDRIMMYAVVYVDVETARDVDIGLASDDSVQVLLDGEEIWIHNIARGSDAANVVQDLLCSDVNSAGCTNFLPPVNGLASTTSIPQLAPLAAGKHILMVKVFEGGGGHNFRLRFQDPDTGEPITEGISACLSPDLSCAGPVVEGGFHRGDADANDSLQLTDAIRILGVLFLGQGVIPCDDAADADDNGSLQLTDAIRILGVLFLGQGTIPAPGPTDSPCGPDPTADALDCANYPGGNCP